MKKIMGLLMAAVMISVLAACGGGDGGGSKISEEDKANATELKLVATNFQFDQSEYKVKKGDTLKIVLDNQEGIHGIEIKGAKIKLDNSNTTDYFKADKAGTYDIICNIPCGQGHATMKSKLIVEE
ncbi:Cytochrome c oxidase subunit 2 [Chlamydia abortus]|jgi:cytochrome c oxidase subunit 2|uniref:Cytochrome C oxidase subunit II n=1 Tax=Paenibacillus residui TaxID=629724 RepID=A0ABW3DFU4_9BACL|nr:Cytochrome c oxidase subunit 2 [Chlamydia abortus]